MGEIEGLRERLEAARRAYAALPRDGWGQPGAVDEATGERWDRGNVLGHVAEMLPYWTGQVRDVLSGQAGAVGRDAVGSARRRMGIDSGREAGEDGLLDRIDGGMGDLLDLLGGLQEADLDRPLRYRPVGADDREVDVRYALGYLLVGHVEDHLEQLNRLPA
jgi:hypothetical protein